MINNVQKIRKYNKLTQEHVARAVDISLNSYQNIEAEKQTPSVKTALKIAKVLNCKVEDLFVLID